MRTNVVILLLVLQAVLLTSDVTRLLVEPIERIGEFLRPARNTAIERICQDGQTWDSAESMSTKLLLAAVESLRYSLAPEASRNFSKRRMMHGVTKTARQHGSFATALAELHASSPTSVSKGKSLFKPGKHGNRVLPMTHTMSWTSESTDVRWIFLRLRLVCRTVARPLCVVISLLAVQARTVRSTGSGATFRGPESLASSQWSSGRSAISSAHTVGSVGLSLHSASSSGSSGAQQQQPVALSRVSRDFGSSTVSTIMPVQASHRSLALVPEEFAETAPAPDAVGELFSAMGSSADAAGEAK